MGRCANETEWPRPSLSLRSQATSSQSNMALLALSYIDRSGDMTFGDQHPESPNSNSPFYKIWHSGRNLIPAKFSHYTVIALRVLNVAH